MKTLLFLTDTSLARSRGRRAKVDKTGRLAALERLKKAKASGERVNRYEVGTIWPQYIYLPWYLFYSCLKWTLPTIFWPDNGCATNLVLTQKILWVGIPTNLHIAHMAISASWVQHVSMFSRSMEKWPGQHELQVITVSLNKNVLIAKSKLVFGFSEDTT